VDRPVALKLCPASIPSALKAIPHWVVWAYVAETDPETREVSWDKPPLKVGGGLASSINPKTWATSAEALAAYERGNLDGVGFVLHRGKDEVDGLVGIDLDRCRDPETGAIEPWARAVVDTIRSYTEVSPSGRGLRIFLKGKLPPQGRKKGRFEVYENARYVTVTGRHLPTTPPTIESRHAELGRVHRDFFGAPTTCNGASHSGGGVPTDLDDAEIVRRAGAAKGGDKFKALWSGSTHGYASTSEADLALVSRLAFWTGPRPDRIDALFRQSGLFRSKWQRDDYRQRTIQKALASRSEYYTPQCGRAAGNGRGHQAHNGASGNGRKNDKSDNEEEAADRPDKGSDQALANPAPATPRKGARSPAPYRPFPIEALPAPLGEYVRQGALALGCDPAYLALPVLAVAASAIGNTRTIRLRRDWEEPAVVWSAIIGESGTLKSPAYHKAVGYFFRLQQTKTTAYRKELAAHKAQKRKQADDPPEEPVLQRIVCSDTTIERLAEILEDNDRGLLVARDELAGWLGSFSRYKGKQGGTDVPLWLEAHRAGTWIYDRKHGERKHYFVPHAAVSVCGGIQPGVLARALTPEFFEAGLAARLLMAMPPKLAKKWSEVEISPEVEQAYQAVLDRLLNLDFKPTTKADKEPRTLSLSREAKAAWVAFYDDWARQQAAAEGELAAAFSKLEGYAARFSLLHHVVTCVGLDVKDHQHEVGVKSIQAGVTLCHWFANEVRRIYATLGETAEDRRVRRLVEFIQAQGGKITVRRLQRSNPTKYQSADQAEADLNELAQSGLGEWVAQPTTEKGGHPTVLFVLKPHLTVDTTDRTPCPEEEGNVAHLTQPPDTTSGGPQKRGESEGSVSCVNCQVKENEAVPSGHPEASSQTTPGVVSSEPEYRREHNPFDSPETSP
jgi:primase-polymerase (primpol)-like protein